MSPGGKYAGYNPIFQGDNSGPHEEDQYLTFVREHCTSKGWHWEPQALHMPHMNVLDLSVYTCMSRRHAATARKHKGKHVISKNYIWEIALEAWEKMQSSKIASEYVQAYHIAGEVVEAEVGNEFIVIGGTPNVRISKYFYPTNKGLARKYGIHMPTPPPSSAEAAL